MGRFVCETCRSQYRLPEVDLVAWACCELCGVLKGDWTAQRVVWAGGPRPDPAVAARRVRLLQRLADLQAGPAEGRGRGGVEPRGFHAVARG